MGVSLIHFVLFVTSFLVERAHEEDLRQADSEYLSPQFVVKLEEFSRNTTRHNIVDLSKVEFCARWGQDIDNHIMHLKVVHILCVFVLIRREMFVY